MAGFLLIHSLQKCDLDILNFFLIVYCKKKKKRPTVLNWVNYSAFFLVLLIALITYNMKKTPAKTV